MAGILQTLQDRKDYLRSLRESNPEAYTDVLKKGFEKSLSLLRPKETTENTEGNSKSLLSKVLGASNAHVDATERATEVARRNAEREHRGQEQQILAVSSVDRTIKLTSNSVVNGLQKILLELRKGFKSVRQSGGMGELGAGAAAAGAGKGKLAGLLKGNALPIIGGVLGAIYMGRTWTNDELTTEEKTKETTKFAGGTAGALLGGKAGAAIGSVVPGVGTVIGGAAGAGLGYLAGSFGTDKALGLASSAGDMLKNTAIGTAIGRGAAVAMSPFSEDARKSLVNDWRTNIQPGLQSVGTAIVESTTGLVTKFNDFTKGISDFKDQVRLSAGNLWGSAKAAAVKLSQIPAQAVESARQSYKNDGVAGAVKAAVRTTSEVTRSAYKEVESAQKVSSGILKGRWSEEEKLVIGSTSKTNPGGFRAGKALDAETKEKIVATAKKYGIAPDHMLAIAQMESGGNTNAVSPTGAAGLYQFTSGTAKQYGLTNRFDSGANIDAAARLYLDNKKALEKAGIAPTKDNMYIAHQQGAGGAIQIIRASQGNGEISEQVSKNIGLNVGGKEGSIHGYLAANSRALARASEIAGATNATDTATPGNILVSRPQISPTMTTAMTKQNLATSKSAQIPKVAKNIKPEVSKVEVTNPDQSKQAAAGVQKPQPTGKSRQSVVTTLSEIPPFFPDITLMNVMVGRYG